MTSTDPASLPALPAPDQTERVILRAVEEEGGTGCPCDLLVLGDTTGALTAAALELVAEQPGARVRSWSTSHAETRRLAARLPDALAQGRLVLATGAEPEAQGHGGGSGSGASAAEPVALEEFAAAADAHLVLARLPKSLAALEDLARRLAAAVARSGRDDLTLVAGGRVKHMTRSQNDALAAVFAEVRGSRGLGKSRALIASSLRTDVAAAEPAIGEAHVRVRGQERPLALRGLGGVFGGARADAGSLLLLGALDDALVAGELTDEGGGAGERRAEDRPAEDRPAEDRNAGDPAAEHVAAEDLPASDGGEPSAVPLAIDLGCGNGLLTAYLADAFPQARVLGSDDDADAAASTRATLSASGLDRDGVEVSWDESLSQVADHSADLVLLNPPFHDGTVVDATLVQGLLDAAARVLRPGGQLWFVHNSHLRYRGELEARFGVVRQRARDRRFTVLSAVA